MFPEGETDTLAQVVAEHFWFRSRNELVIWALGRYFPHPARILDVGCGTGFVLTAIRAWSADVVLVGSDVDAAALEVARHRVPTATFARADAQHLEHDEEFDVVCALDVLEHVDDDDGALTRIAAATRPGGGVLVNVPQYAWLWSSADDYLEHRRRYAKAELERKVRGAGLTILRSFAWMGPLLPVVAVSRLRDRRRTDYDPLREFRVPRPVGRTFETILGLERGLIQRGASLPWGSSRFVVAFKP